MFRAVWFIAFVLCISGLAAGQGRKAPAFRSYPVRAENASAKRIDFRNSPGASAFQTRLRDALRGGVNFGGRYVIAAWGCGTGCVSGAVIDARSGRVHFPKEFNALAVAYSNDEYADPLEYRKNSRMLILRGVPGTASDSDPDGESGTYYYEWRNEKFRLIRFVKNKD